MHWGKGRAPIARRLRRASTGAELKLWPWLRGKRFDGLKFRRQHPIGPFFADFACCELKLVIELDGAGHFDQAKADADRTAFLRSRGWEVLQFGNHEVELELHAVLETIVRVVELRRENGFPSP